MSARLKIALGLALTVPAMIPFGPVEAQRNSNEAVLIVFGDEACPRDTICVRKPQSEKQSGVHRWARTRCLPVLARKNWNASTTLCLQRCATPPPHRIPGCT